MPKSYYPPKSLREATIIARTIVESGGGQPMVRLTIAKELELEPEGRAFRDLLTASGGYGLTRGSYRADAIELLDLGRRIVDGELDAAYEALFLRDLFAEFHSQYKNAKVPSQQAGHDFLKRDCAVPDGQVKAVYSRILQDGRDWQIVQEIEGAERVVPLEMAKRRVETAVDIVGAVLPAPSRPAVAEKLREEPPERRRVEVERGLQLNIAIHIAADMSEEKIETIFKNMKKYLLPDE
jgi:hypothetical protein